jgi:hypothetical protein
MPLGQQGVAHRPDIPHKHRAEIAAHYGDQLDGTRRFDGPPKGVSIWPEQA